MTRTRVPWWRAYKRQFAPRDAIAGLVAACVVVPQCVAFASLAGLPAEAGLYVATLPLVLLCAARWLALPQRHGDVDDLGVDGADHL